MNEAIMRMNNKALIVTGGVLALALLGGGAAVFAQTATPAGPPSDGEIYVYDSEPKLVTDNSSTWKFDSDIYAAGSASNYSVPITCPATSSGVSFFMSPVGNERTPAGWSAWTVAMFPPDSHDVLLATLTPQTFIGGNALAVKAAGGRYSLGFVCTSSDGVTVDKAYYRAIDMTGGSGDFTVEKR